MVLRYQFFGNLRVVDPLTNLAGHELGRERIGALVRQDVPVIADPNTESGFGIQLLPESLPLFRRGVEGAARVWGVDETAGRLPAASINFLVAGFDVLLLFRRDLRIMQRCRPVGMALEHGQMFSRLGDFRNRLDRGRTRADDTHPLALERYRLVRPAGGVEGLAPEVVAARNVGECRRGEHTKTGNDERCAHLASIFEGNGPLAGFVVEFGGSDGGVESYIAAEVVLIGDKVQIFERIRLR